MAKVVTNGIEHDDHDHGAAEAAKHGVARSDKWPTVRKHHLQLEPLCQWCGSATHVEVHHIAPFHLRPELELEPTNHITLCENDPLKADCHYHHGHNGTSWKDFNPAVRAECAVEQEKRHVG